jgi:hypothetical protein
MKAIGSSIKTGAMLAAALFSLLIATQITVSAQGGSRPSSIQRRIDQLNRQGEQFERDNAVDEPHKNDRSRSLALAEVRKELESLQASYNRIVLAMAANKPADDPQIIQAVVEIKHCSVRLKRDLALPQPKDDKEKPADVAATAPDSKAPVMALRKYIYSFVMSPLFESPAVLDVAQAKNASRDLDKIIELSDSITKTTAKRSH